MRHLMHPETLQDGGIFRHAIILASFRFLTRFRATLLSANPQGWALVNPEGVRSRNPGLDDGIPLGFPKTACPSAVGNAGRFLNHDHRPT